MVVYYGIGQFPKLIHALQCGCTAAVLELRRSSGQVLAHLEGPHANAGMGLTYSAVTAVGTL